MATSEYALNTSEKALPTVDDHTSAPAPLQNTQLEYQIHTQLSPHTYAQFRPQTEARDEQTNSQHGQRSIQPPMGDLKIKNTIPVPDPSLKDKAHALVEETTDALRKNFAADSHELARDDHEIKGAIQTPHGTDYKGGVRDIGWHKDPVEIPDPLIGGIPNSRLWAMIRRFNKDVFDVRAVPLEVVRGLDLNEAWAEDHATDKITLALQRIYLTIVLDLVSLANQISRLRSWKETRRTLAFCVAYFTAWHFDLLVPLVLGILIIIVASKPARNVIFPPTPRALVNISTGGLQKPQAGQLGTSDTITGAPEKQEGEAVQEEASNFVDNVRHLVMWASGMHDKDDRDGDPLEGKVPKPVRNVIKSVKAADSAPGHATETTDQTQEPMEEILWSKVKPKYLAPVVKAAPHAVGEISDNWERFTNAISPTPPFSRFSFIRIEFVLLPLFLISFFISYYMAYKGIGLAFGFGVFGDPILTPAREWLNRNYPKWMVLLEPKNNFLRGVPTNSQLTLTLLRIGEAQKTPLPPVPKTRPEEPDQHNSVDIGRVPLDASPTEVSNAVNPSPTMEKKQQDATEDDQKNGSKHKHLSKIISIFKGHTKAAVETKIAVDHARAAIGSEKAKGQLGVLPKPKNLIYAGPSEFKARFEGKKGWIHITESATPRLLFTHHDPRPDGGLNTEYDPVFTIEIKEIKRLKRATAYAGKAAEMTADWSSEKSLLGSLEIDDDSGKTWRVTAIPERDELFNRLVAIGDQRWENM